MEEILAKHTLEERFDTFVRDYYGSRPAFIVSLIAFIIPYGLLYAGHLAGSRYLGYLVPRSAISIGLSEKRYKDYLNVFRFIVFTVLVGGILGVVGNLIASLL
jgi:hypothetical protein